MRATAYITRDIHSNPALLKLRSTEPAITWKVYVPSRHVVVFVNTFTEACVIAGKDAQKAAA